MYATTLETATANAKATAVTPIIEKDSGSLSVMLFAFFYSHKHPIVFFLNAFLPNTFLQFMF